MKETVNVAGDSVIGSEIDGSVILPMPKATDANAAQWGGSDLTVNGSWTTCLLARSWDDEFIPARFFGRNRFVRSYKTSKKMNRMRTQTFFEQKARRSKESFLVV